MERKNGKKQETAGYRFFVPVVFFCIAVLFCACGKETAAETSAETESFVRPAAELSADAVKDRASEVIGDFESKVLVGNLSPSGLLNFTELYRTVASFEKTCYLPAPCSEEELKLLMTLLHTECPELFQYDETGTYHMGFIDGQVHSVEPAYRMEKEEYDSVYPACLETAKAVAEKAEEEEGDEARELAVYRMLCPNITYTTEGEFCGTARGVLLDGAGKCDGISLSFKWVMDLLDIPAVVIPGDALQEGEVGHAWNKVLIGGDWCVVDATQDCQSENREVLCYPAFNVTDDFLYASYRLQEGFETLGTLDCTTMEHSFHVLNGSYLTGTEAKEAFLAACDRQGESGQILLQYEDPEAWETFMTFGGDWAAEWMESKRIYGKSSTVCVEGFRVAAVTIIAGKNSGRIAELDSYLTETEAELTSLSAELEKRKTALYQAAEEIYGLQKEMNEIASIPSDRLTREDVDRYNALSAEAEKAVESYNADVETCNRMASEYEALRSEYNSAAAEWEKLVQ